MNPSSNTTSITEVVPWSIYSPRTIVVGDSIPSDGRFVLYALASQVLAAAAGRVAWLSLGGPWTERLVARAMKKMGCEAANSYLHALEKNSGQDGSDDVLPPTTLPLRIRCIANENARRIDEHDNKEEDNNAYTINMEEFVKKLYLDVKDWVGEVSSGATATRSSPCWIILDDVSTLSELVGARITYALIQSLSALSTRTEAFGLLIRCSFDMEQDDFLKSTENAVTPSWVGAGGQGGASLFPRELSKCCCCWESSLVELADGMIDVVPLASGYTREAHGRLIFSECPGGSGWVANANDNDDDDDDRSSNKTRRLFSNNGNTADPVVVNYCLNDSTVSVIRIRNQAR